MEKNKVEFSEKELRYLNDTDFLKTKRQINEKINQLMVTAEEKISNLLQNNSVSLPEGTLSTAGKISRGENYKQLPYFMLDFPRKFSKKGVFAFRTMFWWGNFFSATLHLQGINLEQLREPLLANLNLLYGKNIYFCVAETPWEYHYGSDNYQPVDQLDQNELYRMMVRGEFIKLSRKLDLENWQTLPDFAVKTLESFLVLLRGKNGQSAFQESNKI